MLSDQLNDQAGILQRWLSDKPGLFNPEVAVNLLEEEPIGICFVKRIKPCALLLTGLQLPKLTKPDLSRNRLCSKPP